MHHFAWESQGQASSQKRARDPLWMQDQSSRIPPPRESGVITPPLCHACHPLPELNRAGRELGIC